MQDIKSVGTNQSNDSKQICGHNSCIWIKEFKKKDLTFLCRKLLNDSQIDFYSISGPAQKAAEDKVGSVTTWEHLKDSIKLEGILPVISWEQKSQM